MLDESQKSPSTEQGHYNEQTMILRKSCRGMKVTNHPNNKSQHSHKINNKPLNDWCSFAFNQRTQNPLGVCNVHDILISGKKCY